MGGKNGGGNRVLLVPDPCSPSGAQADLLTISKAFQIHPGVNIEEQKLTMEDLKEVLYFLWKNFGGQA